MPYVLYDHDESKLASTKVYDSMQKATEDADMLNNVIILALPVPANDDDDDVV